MKIAHIVGPDINGGAGRGALWLHQALLDNNLSSHLYTQYPSDTDQSAHNIFSLISRGSLKDYWLKFDRLLLRKYPNRDQESLFSPGFYGSLLAEIESLNDYDIVHLHWINGGLLKTTDLDKIKKPIVWTIRDMWPFTGGCHYSLDCQKYTSECGDCPQLNSHKATDLSYQCFKLKKENIGDHIYPVAISPWLQKEIQSSNIFQGRSVEMINNGINTSLFPSEDKERSRQEFGLPLEKKIIGIGAINLSQDKRKGLAEFLRAMVLLDQDYEVIVFGTDHLSADIPQNIHCLGHLNNNQLAKVYSAMDVFVAPSLQEAFGKTIAEAMYCGTPVVTFDNSGAADLITEGVTGFKAKYRDIDDLALKIDETLKLSSQCAEDCRKHIEDNYNMANLSQSYIDLYQKILK